MNDENDELQQLRQEVARMRGQFLAQFTFLHSFVRIESAANRRELRLRLEVDGALTRAPLLADPTKQWELAGFEKGLQTLLDAIPPASTPAPRAPKPTRRA